MSSLWLAPVLAVLVTVVTSPASGAGARSGYIPSRRGVVFVSHPLARVGSPAKSYEGGLVGR